ncbi:MAG: hypothetical protein AAGG48_28735 [Planctomycetota bacterium]
MNLEFLGVIEKERDGQQMLTDSAWLEYGATVDAFVPPPPQFGMNPATGERIELNRWPIDRAVKQGDEFLVVFLWESIDTPYGSGQIVVKGNSNKREEAIQFARKCAADLDADFIPS